MGPDCPWRYVIACYGDNFNLGGLDDLKLDASAYDGILLYIRGSGHKLRVKVWSRSSFLGKIPDDVGNKKYYDKDSFGYVINSTPQNWTVFIIYFSELQREGPGKHMEISFDKSYITAIVTVHPPLNR